MKKLIDFLKLSSNRQKAMEWREIEIELSEFWDKFDQGKSLGTKGSERGIIVFDQENRNGARITIETQCSVAPFAITFGIYGLMFHTNWFNSESAATNYVQSIVAQIETVFDHYNIEESSRHEVWQEKLNKLIEDLAK